MGHQARTPRTAAPIVRQCQMASGMSARQTAICRPSCIPSEKLLARFNNAEEPGPDTCLLAPGRALPRDN